MKQKKISTSLKNGVTSVSNIINNGIDIGATVVTKISKINKPNKKNKGW